MALAVALAACLTAGSAQAETGAKGIGDPLLPYAGNGGYDVSHYDLALRWIPDHQAIHGRARISMVPSVELSRFDLDLRRQMAVRSVLIDGRAAAFDQSGRELVITPAEPLVAGAPVLVDVAYRGSPKPISLRYLGFTYAGWISHGNEAFVANEPDGASTWFPANDHPLDKAKRGADAAGAQATDRR